MLEEERERSADQHKGCLIGERYAIVHGLGIVCLFDAAISTPYLALVDIL